jgi:hypothetical protein
MIPFDGRRTFGAPEYFAELTKDRRLLTRQPLKPNASLGTEAMMDLKADSRLAGVRLTILFGPRTAAVDPLPIRTGVLHRLSS